MQPTWGTVGRAIGVTALFSSVAGFMAATTLLHRTDHAAGKRETTRIVADGAHWQSSAIAVQPQHLLASVPGRLIVPVVGIRSGQLIDTFEQARAQGARRHDALDIPAERGTPVLAAAEGQIEKLFLSDAGGNTVYVRSPDRRTLYYYAHLDSYEGGLREGLQVRQGSVLGRVGTTGNADPAVPHLHFAIWAMDPQQKWWSPGTAINPYPLLTGAGRRHT